MSIIFGINVSDRVYIASDTRVTHIKGNVETYKDCICKNGVLTKDVMVAAAGDVKFSSYLYNELKKEKFIAEGINEIKRIIKEWAAKKIDEFLIENSYANACLIIAGLDRSKNKKINGPKYISRVKEFQSLRNAPMAMKNTVFKGISAEYNQHNPNPELPVCDATVIALLSDTKRGILETEEAAWGEFLAYGQKGFTKEDVPKTLFGQLEFEQGDIFRDGGLLTAFIHSTAEQKKLGGVGGSVVVNAATNDNGVVLVAGTIHRMNIQTRKEEIISKIEVIDGKLYGRTQSGLITRLIDFYNYKVGEGFYFL